MEERPAVESIGQSSKYTASAPAIAFAWSGAALFVASLTFFLYAYLVRFGAAAPPGSWFPPAAVDVALFTVFALHHSLLARTPLKAQIRRIVGPSLERSVYTWIASGLFLLVCGLWQPIPGLLYQLEQPWRSVAYGAQAAAVLLVWLSSRAIDVFDLAGIRPLMRARPEHVPLMTTGVYGIVRHPLYFGWALLVFGAPDMTATRAVFAAVSTAYCALAIRWEERGLVEVFGKDYDAYRRKVQWKMVPGLY